MKIIEQQVAGRAAGKYDISDSKCILRAKEVDELSDPRSKYQASDHTARSNLSNRIHGATKMLNKASIVCNDRVGHHESDLPQEHHGERWCIEPVVICFRRCHAKMVCNALAYTSKEGIKGGAKQQYTVNVLNEIDALLLRIVLLHVLQLQIQ